MRQIATMEDTTVFRTPGVEPAGEVPGSGTCRQCARCKSGAGPGCRRLATQSKSVQSVLFASDSNNITHFMSTISKTFLILSISGIAVGSIIAFGNINTNNVGLLMAMPLGAIAIGGFLIFRMMEKEMNRFDREETERHQLVERHRAKQGSGRASKTPVVCLSPQKGTV